MDIFRFINSRDIREYLQSQNYPFTSLEAAWLIYQCRCATIKEKHEAWQELIQTMPDCAVAERPHTALHESLHQFLKEYIRTENEILDWFFRDEKDAIYNCEFWEYAMWCPGGEYFDSFQKCLKAYTDRRLGKMTFKITKQILNSDQCTYVIFSADNEPLTFDTSWYPEGGDEILYGVLGGLEFDFPTPFTKGDILCESEVYEMNPSLRADLFVITDLPACSKNESYRDGCRMKVWGFFLKYDGTLQYEDMYNYMNLEYFRGEFSGKRRGLKASTVIWKGK